MLCRLFAAHKLYPVRVRLVKDVSRTVEWVTVAYIPIVRQLPEPAADERARIRRCGILQRVIYAAFTNVIGRSHIGFRVHVNDQRALAFLRILLYLCDQPEERAVLGLKGGQCAHPCTLCMAKVNIIGAPEALTAEDRKVINTLTNQVEVYEHTRRQRERRRRMALGALESTSGGVPAPAGMAGLGTAPHMLYNMIGFDVLHVSVISFAWKLLPPCMHPFSMDVFLTACLALLPVCPGYLHRCPSLRSWILACLECLCIALSVCFRTCVTGASLLRDRGPPRAVPPSNGCSA